MFRHLVVIALFFLVACGNSSIPHTNPLLGFLLGSEEAVWMAHRDRLVSDEILAISDRDEESYWFYFPIGYDSTRVKLTLNPDGYKHNKLRVVEIAFLKDTTGGWMEDRDPVQGQIQPSDYSLEYVGRVYPQFLESFGQPDSITYKRKKNLTAEAFKSIADGTGYEPTYDTTGVMYWWNVGDYSVELFGEDEHVFGKHYNNVAATFRMRGYHEEYAREKEEARRRLKPSDLVKIPHLEQPEFGEDTYWNGEYVGPHRIFAVEFNTFKRDFDEEPRGITDVQFAIAIKSRFDEELCRLSNCEYSFDEPLRHGESKIMLWGGAFRCETRYQTNTEIGLPFERARIKGGPFKVEAVIKKVVFEDGEILGD